MRQQFFRSSNMLIKLLALLPLICTSNAIAQQTEVEKDLSEEEYFALEEVVVTARKRQESIQDTPIAVTAMDQMALESANIRSINELSQHVPGLKLTKGSTGGASVNIRGIGQRDNRVTLEPGAAIYVDGVYIARQEGSMFNTMEIQNIQVLRGPQGTLFGKNTISGAVLVESVKPGEEWEAFVEGRAGNYNRRDVRMGVNIPIIEDKFFSRFSYSNQKMDGYMENVFLDTEASNENKQAAIAQLRWLATDELVVDFRGYWSQQREAGHGLKCIFDETDSHQSTRADPVILSAASEEVKQDYRDSCLEVEDELDYYEFRSEREGKSDLHSGSASVTVDWEIGELGALDDTEFKSITSWFKQKARYSRDFDATEYTLFTSIPSDPYVSTQLAQEFQMIGSAYDESLQFTSGLFFYNDKSEDGVEWIKMGPMETFFAGNPSLLVNANPTLKETNTDSMAIYFQGTYDLNDDWALTGGIRYTREVKEVSGTFNLYPQCTMGNACAGPIGDGLLPDPSSVKDEETFSDWTPMINVTYRATGDFNEALNVESTLMYLTLSQGFKAGGFNFDQGFEELVLFDPEEVDNYELGIKMDALDNRLRFNAALYRMNYTDKQETTTIQTPDPNGGFIPIVSVQMLNAGEAVIKGFEFELTWMPIANLIVDFNANILDADIKDWEAKTGDRSGGQIDINRKDEEFTNTPDYTANIGVSYDLETDWAIITPRLDLYREGRSYFHFDRGSWLASQASGDFSQDGYTLVNARLNFAFADHRTSVALWGKNLGDTFYYYGGTGLVDNLGGGNGVVAEPRTYGVDFRYAY